MVSTPCLLDQMAVDGRDRLVAGDLAEYGVAAGRPIERARERIREQHSAIALDDGKHRGDGLLDIRPDDVANGVPFRQVACAVSSARGRKHVVEAAESRS